MVDGVAPIEMGPATAHEAITRHMVERLADDVAELRGRINALIWTVITAVVVQVVLALAFGGYIG